jgi:hypothetical protein
MKGLVLITALISLQLTQNDRALSAPADPWKALSFLEGTWEARTQASVPKHPRRDHSFNWSIN